MTIYLSSILLLIFGVAFGLMAILLAGYRWGDFAASILFAQGKEKWKAYAAALVPALAFGLSFFFDKSISPYATAAFSSVAAAASAGVFLRWKREQEQA